MDGISRFDSSHKTLLNSSSSSLNMPLRILYIEDCDISRTINSQLLETKLRISDVEDFEIISYNPLHSLQRKDGSFFVESTSLDFSSEDFASSKENLVNAIEFIGADIIFADNSWGRFNTYDLISLMPYISSNSNIDAPIYCVSTNTDIEGLFNGNNSFYKRHNTLCGYRYRDRTITDFMCEKVLNYLEVGDSKEFIQKYKFKEVRSDLVVVPIRH